MEKQPVRPADRLHANGAAFVVPGEVAAIQSEVFPGELGSGPILKTKVMLKSGGVVVFSKLSVKQLVQLLDLD